MHPLLEFDPRHWPTPKPISGLIKLFSYTYLVSPTRAETKAFLARC